ncbi:MAG: cyclic pyranopterin monophosphate synthase MoaC [Rhodospirillaceae bacterium]|jgi:cyclic pyranopterin monophosphate synthase|nr:cyclic pyranopterin monophosphate synthase MoaC [Rhodospirillaceae bacterium]MBT5459616.1 cyclic pyranopterin monophosphate synthase MoaC [Rhodospirillaceae bacterium]MBT5897243.1 cyclic pyranopterin monophosphate synthase MoaC [Rhodospirillaceae bacterium]MBT7755687.1 cyclic pyranopterin monophosphate synthase MoaC [Rhodospirillaceae bacterium]
MAELTHFDAQGNAHMVDVGGKDVTERIARAAGRVTMAPETVALIEAGAMAKGDVLGVARLAGIMAAKRTADLIPLCHPLQLSSVSLQLSCDRDRNQVNIVAEVKLTGRTGVEMEALTAVSVAGLTIYDMCKAVDRSMQIGDVRLIHKSGGKSGSYDAS